MYTPQITALTTLPENATCLKLEWKEPRSEYVHSERNLRVLQIEYHTPQQVRTRHLFSRKNENNISSYVYFQSSVEFLGISCFLAKTFHIFKVDRVFKQHLDNALKKRKKKKTLEHTMHTD